MTREEAISVLVETQRYTREQAEAFIDLMGSAFKRRGWVKGEPLTEEQLDERLHVFVGRPERAS